MKLEKIDRIPERAYPRAYCRGKFYNVFKDFIDMAVLVCEIKGIDKTDFRGMLRRLSFYHNAWPYSRAQLITTSQFDERRYFLINLEVLERTTNTIKVEV